METNPVFVRAVPVWLKELEHEKNVLAGFRASFHSPPKADLSLRIAACNVYRAWLNGVLVAYGPARAAHGHARVDEWPLEAFLHHGQNILAIEVAGYRVNSYSLLDEAPFLQAEAVLNGEIVCATSPQDSSLCGYRLDHKVQRCVRYSFQRTFAEVYRMDADSERWRTNLAARPEQTELVAARIPELLPRRIPLPALNCRQPVAWVVEGKSNRVSRKKNLYRPNFLTDIGPKYGGFQEDQLEANPLKDLQMIKSTGHRPVSDQFSPATPVELKNRTWRIADFGQEISGFPGVTVSCAGPVTLYLIFDEVLRGNDVDFIRMGCVNAITWHLQPGEYHLESIEPYSMRYLKCLTEGGDCRISGLYLRELASPHVYGASFSCSDTRVNRIFEAARNTFRQNAVDIFMDCPSRERAGWLGDSFLAARVENDLTGGHAIEKNFLENFLVPPSFADLPPGMVAMCYPSDHPNGVFIPNWALWLVLQLEEYGSRSNDIRLVKGFLPRVRRMLSYFRKFQNEHGLLEKLESWVFVEWSKANDFVQDVNFPSNMLYAAALDAAGRMYQDVALRREAAALRETIRKMSFDGEFFVDNAVRHNGKLVLTKNRTETCQYFAFFLDIATPQSYPALWKKLVKEFGPDRVARRLHPDVHPANAFMGNYLRMEILSRYGRPRQILDEMTPYFLYMADRTGTLWENAGDYASCNHGFASHVARVLYRDVLGCRIDPVTRTVTLQLANLPLQWCEGRIPTADGPVYARWWKERGKFMHELHVPAGYRPVVQKLTAKAAT